MRPRLVHQALHGRGSTRPLPGAAVRRAHQRRRGHDPLRGLPRQQGLPALVGTRRPGQAAREGGLVDIGADEPDTTTKARQRQAHPRSGRGRRGEAGRAAQTGRRHGRRAAAPSTKRPTSRSRTTFLPRMPYGGSRMLAASFRSIGLDTARHSRIRLPHPGTGRQVHLGRRVLSPADRAGRLHEAARRREARSQEDRLPPPHGQRALPLRAVQSRWCAASWTTRATKTSP